MTPEEHVPRPGGVDVAALREKLDAATPRPWHVVDNDYFEGVAGDVPGNAVYLQSVTAKFAAPHDPSWMVKPNAALIVFAESI